MDWQAQGSKAGIVITLPIRLRLRCLKAKSSEATGTFGMWGRNARVLVLTEPFWSLPMSWIYFYRTIFLSQSIGLSEVQIGLLATVYTFLSTIAPLAGGYLADRFGRKKTLMLFDSVGFLSALTVWFITKDIWFALIAYLLEGLPAVIFSVWECLLVEDTAPKYRASIYGYVSAIYNVGALSTPIAGYLVGLYGVDIGYRTLCAVAFALLVPMFMIRVMLLRETEIGHQIMEEKTFSGFGGYAASLSIIRRNRVMAALLFVSISGSFYYAVARYMPLYLVDAKGIGLSSELASLVPSISSISALMIVSFVVPRLSSKGDYVGALVSGQALGCMSMLLLSFSPTGSLPFVLASGAVLGVFNATAFSVSRTFLTNEIEAVDNRARAKILSITITLSSLLNLPAPILAGYLYSLNPKLPFLAMSSVLVISLAILLAAKRQRE